MLLAGRVVSFHLINVFLICILYSKFFMHYDLCSLSIKILCSILERLFTWSSQS